MFPLLWLVIASLHRKSALQSPVLHWLRCLFEDFGAELGITCSSPLPQVQLPGRCSPSAELLVWHEAAWHALAIGTRRVLKTWRCGQGSRGMCWFSVSVLGQGFPTRKLWANIYIRNRWGFFSSLAGREPLRFGNCLNGCLGLQTAAIVVTNPWQEPHSWKLGIKGQKKFKDKKYQTGAKPEAFTPLTWGTAEDMPEPLHHNKTSVNY